MDRQAGRMQHHRRPGKEMSEQDEDLERKRLKRVPARHEEPNVRSSSPPPVPPSSGVLYGLGGLCVGLLMVIAVLSVVIMNKELNATDQTLNSALTNMSVNFPSDVDILTQQAGAVLTKMQEMQETVQKINLESSTQAKLLESDMRQVVLQLQRLSEWTLNKSHGLDCEAGWSRFQLSCYKLFRDHKNWTDAKIVCEENKSQLVVINSQSEQNYLLRIFKWMYTWIGLTDTDGTWKWSDGSPYECGPKFWYTDQPDDYHEDGYVGGEDCGQLHEAGLWNDAHCSRTYQFICEKDM